MAYKLSDVLQSRAIYDEENLPRGKIYVFGHGNMYSAAGINAFCWKPPGSGTAVIELWGAGGSGARMCCCGVGIPGNPGAYAKKTITVDATCYVTGTVGISCGNTDLCFRGCSTNSGVCWFGSGTNGCICVQGGKGGVSYCGTTTSMWCCFSGNGFCSCCHNPGCGIICNSCPGGWIACAYGSADYLCCGGWSCMIFNECGGSANYCGYMPAPATPYGFWATCAAATVYPLNSGNFTPNWSGSGGGGSHLSALGNLGKNPVGNALFTNCYSGYAYGCYESNGCIPFSPPGHPGGGAVPQGDVRDMGYRGGNGAVRITFFS